MTTTTLAYEQLGPKQAQECIIWLHGLGADGYNFMPIVDQLQLPNTLFIFPHAPVRPITINQGAMMRGWYDIFHFDRMEEEDEKGLFESRAAVWELIHFLETQGFASENIRLAGFSQGAVMALLAGLTFDKKLKSIIALSGYLPLRKKFASLIDPVNAKTPIWMAHGVQDPVLPFFLAEESADRLKALGCSVDWRVYNMAHELCAQQVMEMRELLGG